MFQDLNREMIGVLGLALILLLMLMKVPVAVAMFVGGALGIWLLGGERVVVSTLRTVPFHSVSGWSLSVVPMFIFMGLMLWRAGASERLYEASRHWLGWIPGGLAVGTNVAGAGLASVSGSTLGVTYALGRIGIPEMLRAGYDRRFAVASVLMAGTGGQLIPPSILLVIYAGIASVPVGSQLLAGFLPGVVLTVVYGAVLVTLAVTVRGMTGRAGSDADGSADPRSRKDGDSGWHDRWRTLRNIWPLPVLAGGTLAGLYAGVFTATEAGAFGAAGALLTTCWYRKGRAIPASIKLAVVDTVKASGAIFLLIIGAAVLSRFLTLSGLASWMVTAVSDLDLSRVQFLLVLLVIYLVLGMFVDPLTMMLITVPIVIPILGSLDIGLIWFGVFVVLLGELAVVTPPVGVLTFVVHKLAQEPEVNLGHRITLSDVFVAVLWFLPASLAVLVLLILVPEIAEYIPALAER
ncbi:TRAP transporter large permease [Amycolatopsis marina]|nr:TRAP transporter large permease subunit [Amycolatopsis marina]